MLSKLRDAIAMNRERVSVSLGWNSVPEANAGTAVGDEWVDGPAEAGRRRFGWKKWLLLGLVGALGVAVVVMEVRTSWLQSRLFRALLQGASYKVERGEAGGGYYPGRGPYDERLGYARLEEMIARAKKWGYQVEAQARWSPRMQMLGRWGTFPVYVEKSQAGLRVLGRNGMNLHTSMFPAAAYEEFGTISPLIIKTALYIENREILDSWAVHRNPAIEWDRLAKALVDYGVKQVVPGHSISGGSTLATQLEKIRHSPQGRTASLTEKARQITTASLRAYQGGTATIETRRRIVRDYINSLPLAATVAHGEIIGLADGLSAWYGTDPHRANELLLKPENRLTAEEERERALAFRQVLSLLLAINRPTYYLRQNPQDLSDRAERYLRVMAAEGLISTRLRDLALLAKAELRPAKELSVRPAELERKGTDAVRASLLGLLGLSSLYELDRLDLTAETTLHGQATRLAAETMQRLNDPEWAAQAGLVGSRLLGSGQGEQVIYTLTLFERGASRNRLLVQLDSTGQALNLNEGSKLELGSTAKLRTLVTYLEVVATIRQEMVTNRKAVMEDPDNLTAWMAEYLQNGGDPALEKVLEAAMERRYSGSPGESFWTGGGVHAFANFDGADNGRMLTVREGFRRSVNLVFIRMMRDIVEFHMRRLPSYSPGLFSDDSSPARQKLLARFADREGSEFLRAYYTKYAGLSGDEAVEKLFSERKITASRFSVMYRSVRPSASFGDFQLAMMGFVNENVTEKRMQELYDMYGPGKFTWQDRGYVASVHPLELWLVNYLQSVPEADWTQVRDASRYVRQEVYRWLFTSKSKHGQNLRIRSVLEIDAFAPVLESWKRQGFPFRYMVPSLASAIGSSGDTPAALAELAGVILNEGVHAPSVRVERLRLAEGTPFETVMTRKQEPPRQAIAPEIARRVREEMRGVVQFGTARRAFASVKSAAGEVLAIGGKTGTGDNRTKSLWKVGKARNRTAAFVFTVGEKYFGTVVAYVPGEQAANYSFSSALPLQVFKLIVPRLIESVEQSDKDAEIQAIAANRKATVVAPAAR
jgi:membrane peptidoglycan carboxypeptidase